MSWQRRRARVSVLTDMALRREHVVATLLELQARHSLSQEDAARKIGIGLRQYQRWVTGQSMPRASNLGKAATAYGVAPNVFYEEQAETLVKPSSQLDVIEAKVDALLRQAGIEPTTLDDILTAGADDLGAPDPKDADAAPSAPKRPRQGRRAA